MCGETMREEPSCLPYVPDWFVTQQQIELWDDVDDYCNNHGIIELYDGYKNARLKKHK